ncbi:MAG: AAA family ATPase [Planctomycetes bacterium]|nr:AAA family ATPase [Planctomycetota bacterium]
MKVLRLHLRNWRGVADREVRFAPTGVTVVEGPNEAGKSSLVEALDLLFDEMDSSGKARVRSVKPVHADVGASVEAEIESGAYAFTYAKTFHKKAGTQLTVAAPRGESLNGRAAHERADAILRETLDVPLWKALRVPQGGGMEQAEVTASGWLGRALDHAAGGTSKGSDREDALFDRVRAQRDRWWTDRGTPKKELAEAEQRFADAAAEAERLQGEVTRLEQDVERAAHLAKDVARLEAARVETERRAEARARDLAGLATLRAARDDAEKRLAQAETARARALAARDERTKLTQEVGAADDEAAAAATALEAEAPGLDAARVALAEAEAALQAAESTASAASRAAQQAARDFEFRDEELALTMLEERSARLDAADRAAEAAEATVARVRVDDPGLVKLRKLNEAMVKAQVRLDAASASLRVEALADCAPSIDGVAAPMSAGESRDVRVSGAARIEIPGLLRIDVRSGAGTEEPRAEFDRHKRAFDDALAAAGVASLDEAAAANADLREAKRALVDRDRVATEALRDLSRETLVRKVENLRPRVAAYRAQRAQQADSPPLPADYDAAQEARRRTKDDAASAAIAVETTLKRRETVRRRAEDAAVKLREGEVKRQIRGERAAELRRLLDRAEADVPMEALARALADADAKWTAVAAEATTARDALGAAQPDIVEGLARTSRAAADRARDERYERERELAGLRAALAVRGEDGLAEKRGAADAALDAARRDAVRKRAQAVAAKTLFDTIDAERGAERARYVAPFREKVESLGRIVFGDDFAVDVSDDLRIVSRTLGGRTVEFESLSGGAKEQIGVIARAACAILAGGAAGGKTDANGTVSPADGVPILLDDSFGWSDPDRLERMGALLAVVGRSCQVILLTCDPARARGIPGATVVRVG